MDKFDKQIIAELKKKGLLPNEILPDIEYTITENDTYYLISCFLIFTTIMCSPCMWDLMGQRDMPRGHQPPSFPKNKN